MTKKIGTLEDLFVMEVRDIYDAEKRLTKALPKMAKKAKTETLKNAFELHLEETENQIVRLEKIFDILDTKAQAKTCEAMKGLIEEGKEALKDDAPDQVQDAHLIAAAQKVEHYEIASYGTLVALAEQLGLSQIAKLLDQTLEEEKAADEKLTSIAESDVYAQKANWKMDENDEYLNQESESA